MRISLIVLLIVILAMSVFLSPTLSGEGKAKPKAKPTPKEASLWMEKKLEYTQNIVAGLTEADYDKISSNAGDMDAVGNLETWFRADNPEYKRQASYFEFANRELVRQAEEKNLDGATLAYNQLMVSCVACHKIVRDAKAKK